MITLVLKISVNFYGDLKDQKYTIVMLYFIPFVIYPSFLFFLTTAFLGEKYNATRQIEAHSSTTGKRQANFACRYI